MQFPEPLPPPAHLSPSSAKWWETTVRDYVLEEHHLRLLQLACESWDRCQAARAELESECLTVPAKDGGIRPHPCIAIEVNSRLACARLIRELDLDTTPPTPARVGPPGLFSNARGRAGARKAASS
jgi:phage terminase small subunit